MLALTQVYCIDICAYAIMTNHYHLVVHINRSKALSLSSREVVERWQQDHKLPSLVMKWLEGQLANNAEIEACMTIIESWRERLWSLSWFMKELNFDIACQANREDECKGHFWESRFKSQALLDEKALAAAMAYVDLNPLRAGIAKTPESSDYTSIQARIEALNNQQETAPCLHPFIGTSADSQLDGIPFRLIDYIELVDWSARQFREDKAQLSKSTPPILERLNINQLNWFKACTELERPRTTSVGCIKSAMIAKRVFNRKRINLFRLDS
ncbi:transposase [Vibrio brasiliensis]|uniref:transposase n=1 Tax=Vibrio brasiliensis TaxID=170652 RepID=UPI001EFE4B7B|nr:transposase [Vibrio brasiliensis]MCG9783554.1 transposase [Vibrio brasiliensis]